MRHYFQMPWVAAWPVAAKVVDFKALRNGADVDLVGGAMSIDAAAVVGRLAISSRGVAVPRIRPAGLEIAATDGCFQVSSEDCLTHSEMYNRSTLKTMPGDKP